LVSALASPAPASPICGAPSRPKISIQASSALTGMPATSTPTAQRGPFERGDVIAQYEEEEEWQQPHCSQRSICPAIAASAGSWSISSNTASPFHITAQSGIAMVTAAQQDWRTVRRTSRTELDRRPRSLAIIGEAAVISPMPKIMQAV
jgi:hypothetical protein